jgi:hypothetical protein
MMPDALDVPLQMVFDLCHLLLAPAEHIADKAIEMLMQLWIAAVAASIQLMWELQLGQDLDSAIGINENRHSFPPAASGTKKEVSRQHGNYSSARPASGAHHSATVSLIYER